MNNSARTAGLLYLFIALVAPLGMMVIPSRLMVPGDAAATAANIVASEGLFRLGMVSDSLVFLSEVLLTAVLFILFEPVSRTGSLIAAFARLSMTVVQGVNVLIHGAALVFLKAGTSSLSSFTPAQLQAVALATLETHQSGVLVWEAFFGLHCLVLGWLIVRSAKIPRLLGYLMAIAGLGYLAHGLGVMALPEYTKLLAAIVGVGAMIGEIPFMLWLLFKGKAPSPTAK